jgi:capsular polysaccharide biosynthesis protein
MYQNLIKTYAEIVQSDRVAQITAKKLKNKYEPKEIQKMLKVTPQQGTQILEIKAENKDRVEVAKIVNKLSETFMEESKKSFPTGGDIQILDSPKVPEEPIKPKKLLNISIAFILGIMASIGTVFVLEYTDTTIKNKNDVERYLDMPVIGIIPKNMEN